MDNSFVNEDDAGTACAGLLIGSGSVVDASIDGDFSELSETMDAICCGGRAAGNFRAGFRGGNGGGIDVGGGNGNFLGD